MMAISMTEAGAACFDVGAACFPLDSSFGMPAGGTMACSSGASVLNGSRMFQVWSQPCNRATNLKLAFCKSQPPQGAVTGTTRGADI